MNNDNVDNIKTTGVNLFRFIRRVLNGMANLRMPLFNSGGHFKYYNFDFTFRF